MNPNEIETIQQAQWVLMEHQERWEWRPGMHTVEGAFVIRVIPKAACPLVVADSHGAREDYGSRVGTVDLSHAGTVAMLEEQSRERMPGSVVTVLWGKTHVWIRFNGFGDVLEHPLHAVAIVRWLLRGRA